MKKGTKLLSVLCVLALLLTMAAPVLATEGADTVADPTVTADTAADTTDATEPAPGATPETTPAEDEGAQAEGETPTTPSDGTTTPTEGDTTTTTPGDGTTEGEGTTTTEPTNPGEGTTTTDPTNPGDGTTTTEPTNPGEGEGEDPTTPPTTDDSADDGFTKGTEEGSDYSWKLVDGVLTIKGTQMPEWGWDGNTYKEAPWSGDVQSVVIETGMTNISAYAFIGNSLTSVTIPSSVTSIGNSAFCDCTSLTSVTIPNSVTSIGNSAFGSCTSLTSVTIPDSVTSISEGTFSRCTSLTSVTIQDGVTSIGESAFNSCGSLTTLKIPASVTSIEDTFWGCSKLTQFEVAAENPNYSVKNGVLYNKEQTKLLLVPHGMTNVYLTGDAPEVADGALDYISRTVYYPNGNATYTEEYKRQYGNYVNWVPLDENGIPIVDIVTATPGQIPSEVTTAIAEVNKALEGGDTTAITTALQAAQKEYMMWHFNIQSRPFVTSEATQSLGTALQKVGAKQDIDLGETGSMEIWGTAGTDLAATVTTDKNRPGVLVLDASYNNGYTQSSTGTYVTIRLPGVTWNTGVTYGWIAEDGQVGHANVTVQDGNTIISFYAPHFSRYIVGRATVPTYSTDTGASTDSNAGANSGSAAILKDTSADVDLSMAILLAMGTLLLCGSAVVLKKRA